MDIKNVRKWCREFNEGRINVHDEQRSGRPSLPESTVNRRITLEEIEDGLNKDCSHFSVHKIVSETLGYRKVSARWVDKWLKEAAGEWYNTGITNDICGPLPTNSLSGKRYFITFTDDYSRYTKTYLLKGKDEAYEKIKDYVISAHTEFGKNIQTIRTDNGPEASQELLWLLDLLKDLELEQKAPIYFHQDNQSCLKICSSEKVSSRTKHIATKIHHLKDLQKKTVIKMVYCPTGDMKADILTKPLPRPTFEKLRYNLVMSPHSCRGFVG
ncbi:hypothetical protein LAZ67_23000838 [Cordylochernes scorpioides]|uniref:Integrase catalytic domain-containing protein n=1 Tax=Cordylochernes scorpioides TaxID=51811 RepID=A0ABY6LQ97_9ARAC|nr:hypothetical protein LAZ67_23000838 [Cordylochernes scorpioides]